MRPTSGEELVFGSCLCLVMYVVLRILILFLHRMTGFDAFRWYFHAIRRRARLGQDNLKSGTGNADGTTTRRLQFSLGTLFFIVLMCAMYFALWRSRPVPRAEWRQVQPGMDIFELLKVMGQPEYEAKSTRAYELNDGDWLWVTLGREGVSRVEKTDRGPPGR